MTAAKKIYKSRKETVIDGVCGGVAEYFHIDVTIVRIIWAASILFKGLGVLAYVIAMIVIPANPDHGKKENKNKNRNYGLIGGILLILFGVMILTDGFDWHYPFNFRFLSWPFHLGSNFWPVLLILGGVFYVFMILKKNNDTAETEKRVDQEKGSKKSSQKSTDTGSKQQRLTRNTADKWVSGICSGFAKYFNIDPVFVRIGFILTALITHIFPLVIIYIILIFVIPEE